MANQNITNQIKCLYKNVEFIIEYENKDKNLIKFIFNHITINKVNLDIDKNKKVKMLEVLNELHVPEFVNSMTKQGVRDVYSDILYFHLKKLL